MTDNKGTIKDSTFDVDDRDIAEHEKKNQDNSDDDDILTVVEDASEFTTTESAKEIDSSSTLRDNKESSSCSKAPKSLNSTVIRVAPTEVKNDSDSRRQQRFYSRGFEGKRYYGEDYVQSEIAGEKYDDCRSKNIHESNSRGRTYSRDSSSSGSRRNTNQDRQRSKSRTRSESRDKSDGRSSRNENICDNRNSSWKRDRSQSRSRPEPEDTRRSSNSTFRSRQSEPDGWASSSKRRRSPSCDRTTAYMDKKVVSFKSDLVQSTTIPDHPSETLTKNSGDASVKSLWNSTMLANDTNIPGTMSRLEVELQKKMVEGANARRQLEKLQKEKDKDGKILRLEAALCAKDVIISSLNEKIYSLSAITPAEEIEDDMNKCSKIYCSENEMRLTEFSVLYKKEQNSVVELTALNQQYQAEALKQNDRMVSFEQEILKLKKDLNEKSILVHEAWKNNKQLTEYKQNVTAMSGGALPSVDNIISNLNTLRETIVLLKQ